MLRRRRHVQILVFVVKLDFRIRIIKGSLKSIISNRDLRKGGDHNFARATQGEDNCYSFTMRRHENMRDPPVTLLAIRQPF